MTLSEHGVVPTLESIRKAAMPVHSRVADEAILRLADHADVVLLGEASHGTHEFYRERARITRMLERAIGVVYRPETERMSYYFHAKILEQFDAVIHFDRTQAVRPLDRTTEWDSDTVPETYPFSV